MTAAITHQDVPTAALKNTLLSDAVLADMEVTGFDGQPRKLQGIHNLEVPQEDETDGPWVVIGPPITHDLSERKHPNGGNLIAADFIVDLMIHCRNIEPDEPGLVAMRAHIKRKFEGSRISVDGGEAFTITIYGYPTPQRINRGGPVFTAIGISFLVAAQVT